MNFLLLDTNIVSILFKPDHRLRPKCVEIVSGSQWIISFMTRGELLLWPQVNMWGAVRKRDLTRHLGLCTTLMPDESTCQIWSDIMTESRFAGKPIATGDAWIAAPARQWAVPLVTTDYRDFDHLGGIKLVRVSLAATIETCPSPAISMHFQASAAT